MVSPAVGDAVVAGDPLPELIGPLVIMMRGSESESESESCARPHDPLVKTTSHWQPS
jgi:hypothetical protein